MKSKIFAVLTGISILGLAGCGGGGKTEEPVVSYSSLDLSGGASLVLHTEQADSEAFSAASTIAKNDIVLYKISETGSLETVKFLDENGNKTDVVYKPECAKNINDNFIATYSSQTLPLKFVVISDDGTTQVSSEIKETSATLFIRKTDGKIFPLSTATSGGYYAADEEFIMPVCDPIITASDMWTLPKDTIMVTANLDGKDPSTLLVKLTATGDLEARKFLLPGDAKPGRVFISPNAIAYDSRVIGVDSPRVGRLLSGEELGIISDSKSDYVQLPDGLNYRRFLEQQNTGTIHEVLNKITFTSGSTVVEEEVYRGTYSEEYEPSWNNWGLIYRYPGTDLFLGENCNWYEYNESQAKKLVLVDSVIPSDIVASYDSDKITCTAMKSSIPNTGTGELKYYEHSGYMTFTIGVEVESTSNRFFIAQYNPHTKDMLVGEPSDVEAGRYSLYQNQFYPYGKGLFIYDGSDAYNSNGDQVFLIFDIEAGAITESIHKPNDTGYFFISPLN